MMIYLLLTLLTLSSPPLHIIAYLSDHIYGGLNM